MTQDTAPAEKANNHGLPEGYKRSSFAVPEDVHQQLPDAIKALGLRSVAALLTLVVRSPEARAALAPSAAKFTADQKANAAGTIAAAKKALKNKIKDMSPEQLERLLQVANDQAEAAGAQP